MHDVKTLRRGNVFFYNASRIIQKIVNNPLLLATLVNLSAFLLSVLIFDVKYETSDDYITDAVLSGVYGNGYDCRLLFGNPILGYGLVLLYELIPKISLYFVLLILLNFVSATVVLFLLFKKKTNLISFCMAVLFLVFFSDDLYILLQFTKTAVAAGISGGLLILYGLWEANKHKAHYIIIGAFMMILGTMLRFSTIYIFSLFLVLAFIYYSSAYIFNTKEKKSDTKKTVLEKQRVLDVVLRFSICALIIGMLFGMQYLGTWFSHLDKNYDDYYEFQSLRYNITDRPIPSFEEVEDEYKELGLDFVDYAMLCSWNFVDREVYSDELLVKVAEIHKEATAERRNVFTAVQTVFNRLVLTYPAAYAVYILSALVIVLSRRRIYPIVLIVSSLAMFVGFVCYGRAMYRVEWAVYYCAASCLLTGFSFNEKSSIANQKKKVFGKSISTIGLYSLILVALLLLTRIPRIFTKYQLLECSDEQYISSFADTMSYAGDYIPDKVGFPSVSRKVYPNIIEYIENDPEHYYVVDFCTGIQDLYFDYEPWIRPEQRLFEHYTYYGGCTMHHPGEKKVLTDIGVDPDNPFSGLINDDIYLVDNLGYEYKILYIRRYYYPNAKIQLIAEIDGFKIWKVYVPESIEESND